MVKKISYLLIAVAIVVAGYIAFNKLDYWERSVRIFSLNSSDQSFQGKTGRGHNEFDNRRDREGGDRFEKSEGFREGFEKHEMDELPDSIIAGFGAEEGFEQPEMNEHRDSERMKRGSFEAGAGERNRHGGDGFPEVKKINLSNTVWFLAVFALFTVISIYFDKAINLIRKRK
jgi:hypothetical protein